MACCKTVIPVAAILKQIYTKTLKRRHAGPEQQACLRPQETLLGLFRREPQSFDNRNGKTLGGGGNIKTRGFSSARSTARSTERREATSHKRASRRQAGRPGGLPRCTPSHPGAFPAVAAPAPRARSPQPVPSRPDSGRAAPGAPRHRPGGPVNEVQGTPCPGGRTALVRPGPGADVCTRTSPTCPGTARASRFLEFVTLSLALNDSRCRGPILGVNDHTRQLLGSIWAQGLGAERGTSLQDPLRVGRLDQGV